MKARIGEILNRRPAVADIASNTPVTEDTTDDSGVG